MHDPVRWLLVSCSSAGMKAVSRVLDCLLVFFACLPVRLHRRGEGPERQLHHQRGQKAGLLHLPRTTRHCEGRASCFPDYWAVRCTRMPPMSILGSKWLSTTRQLQCTMDYAGVLLVTRMGSIPLAFHGCHVTCHPVCYCDRYDQG